MRVPFSLVSELLAVKDYIVSVDADVLDNMLIMYVKCSDAETCKKLKSIIEQVKGVMNE